MYLKTGRKIKKMTIIFIIRFLNFLKINSRELFNLYTKVSVYTINMYISSLLSILASLEETILANFSIKNILRKYISVVEYSSLKA